MFIFYAEPVSSKTAPKLLDVPQAHAFVENDDVIWENLLTDGVQIIGCYNKYTKKTKQPTERGDCLWGGQGGWFNIMLPPLEHISKWKEFYTDHQIINRFPIVNFESSFNPNAGNKFAHGYVQTLRKYRIAPDITSQLEWMYNREKNGVLKVSVNGSKRCGIYWEVNNTKDGYSKGEDGVTACMYRYHYHSRDGTWYARKAMTARDYYVNWFKERNFGKESF